MSRPFLGRAALTDIIKSQERTNSIQKREGLSNHPVTFTVCGCPGPRYGGWHTIRIDRLVSSEADCDAIIEADNSTRKRLKRKSK